MVLRTLGFLIPPVAARLGGALFRLPPRRPPSRADSEALATGRFRMARDGRLRIATWFWGEGPAVLLVHGWGSRGGRLASFIPPLVEAGYSVLAFDAPGHGASPGRLSSLPQFIDATALAAATAADGSTSGRNRGVHGIVAHSMGCAAAAIAMHRGLAAVRAVFVAPPANPRVYLRIFTDAFGIPEPVHDAIRSGFERRFGFEWDDFDVTRMAGAMTTPLLILHDREDPDVPWTDGAAIARAWPGADLVTTEGLGHRRILHDSAVVARAIGFLRAAAA